MARDIVSRLTSAHDRRQRLAKTNVYPGFEQLQRAPVPAPGPHAPKRNQISSQSAARYI